MSEELLLVDEVAAMLRTTPNCIKQQVWLQRFRHLAGLPDPVQRRPMAWLKSDLERWLATRSTFSAGEAEPKPEARRAGRKRKEIELPSRSRWLV